MKNKARKRALPVGQGERTQVRARKVIGHDFALRKDAQGRERLVSGEGDLGGSMRLGAYPAQLVGGSTVAKLYGTTEVSERHRHRYEVNNNYRPQLEEAGLLISGTSPDSTLVEFVELDRSMHPYYVATQAHPELKSRPTQPHPLFVGLVEAALERKLATRLPVDGDKA